VQEGQGGEYGEIVNRYEKAMGRYIKRVTNQSFEEVEDLVQDTFVKAYENIQGFDTKKKFGSWLYRIAHNICIDYFRKKKPISLNVDEQEETLMSNEKLIEELEIEKENKKMMITAVEKLNLKYKEVVLLYFFEDKSYDEIADILRTNTSNVGVLLNRAKTKLKQIL